MQRRDSQVYTVSYSLRFCSHAKCCPARVVRDALVRRADSAIEGFENAFQDLWKSLQETFFVENIEQTYRLVSATESIAEIGSS